MSDFKIEKDHKFPDRFPLRYMDVDDSFALEKSTLKAAYAAANRYSKKNEGKRFSIRMVDHGSYRLWRVK